MAFSTLDAIRTGGLNNELGLESDSDDTWGTTAQRNFFLQRAFAKLWPMMAREIRASLTLDENASDFDITATGLRDITSITLHDSTGVEVDSIKGWHLEADETTDPPTVRLTIPSGIDSSLTCYLHGYKPYAVPASGTATCDLPSALEYIVCAGARVEAYRAKFNLFVNFPRSLSENRANALSASELIELMRSATSDFREYRQANERAQVRVQRAIRTTR